MVTSTHSTRIVEAVGLTKIFKDFWMRAKARAVDHVDFEIEPGELFGLLGPNGSGKSTIIKMILGLLHPTSGRLQVFGRSPSDVAVKRHIGFLPEESYLYRYLTAEETLDYYGRLFGLPRSVRRRRTGELLEMIGLSQVGHRPVGEFSKGMTRRIGIAQALVNDPEFLILDEPTSGLDPIGTRQVKDLLIELRRRGKTILLSSHLLADVEDVCDRMVMLYGGKIRAEGTVDALLEDTQRTVIRTQRLTQETIEQVDQTLHASQGVGIERVEAPRQRLEDLFVSIVEQAQKEHAETSGARHGGTTAAFLLGEEETSTDPGALIEQLATGAPAPTPAAVVPDPEEPDVSEVISDLIAAEGEETVRRDQAQPPPLADESVDRSIIDSLVSDAGEEEDVSADA